MTESGAPLGQGVGRGTGLEANKLLILGGGQVREETLIEDMDPAENKVKLRSIAGLDV